MPVWTWQHSWNQFLRLLMILKIISGMALYTFIDRPVSKPQDVRTVCLRLIKSSAELIPNKDERPGLRDGQLRSGTSFSRNASTQTPAQINIDRLHIDHFRRQNNRRIVLVEVVAITKVQFKSLCTLVSPQYILPLILRPFQMFICSLPSRSGTIVRKKEYDIKDEVQERSPAPTSRRTFAFFCCSSWLCWCLRPSGTPDVTTVGTLEPPWSTDEQTND